MRVVREHSEFKDAFSRAVSEAKSAFGDGTVFIERKFLRGLSSVGHIEDIAVDKSQQGKKLGLRIINALTLISESHSAYKTILNCSDSNVPFYEKCGYSKKENEMVADSSIITLG